MITKMSGNKLYSIHYTNTVVKEDIPALPKTIRIRIRKAIETRLTIAPELYGKPLQHDLFGGRRLRVGDYRVLYVVDPKKHSVLIEAIGHRSIIYELHTIKRLHDR